jgi:putative ABC transport system permease protein
VRRFLLAQLRFRRRRLLALAAGVVVAAVSFTLLTAAATTSQLQVRGAVSENFRSAYDVLVRPARSTTPLEASQGLVQQNYLSGIFGGITLDQYAAIRQVPGVDVAAPIAMVGYALQYARVPVTLPAPADPRVRQLFRVRTTRTSDQGLSRFRDADSYVYVTPRPLQQYSGLQTSSTPGAVEVLESGRRVPVCPGDAAGSSNEDPFDLAGRQRVWCFSRLTDLFGSGHLGPGPVRPEGTVTLPFPFLIAAVDPGQETRLAGVDRAVVAGRYLQASDRPRQSDDSIQIPVLASTRSYVDESAQIAVEDLGAAAAAMVPAQQQTPAFRRLLASGRGAVITRTSADADTAYQRIFGVTDGGYGFDGYWTAGPISYQQRGPLELAPRPVTNPADVWPGSSRDSAPLFASDLHFRTLVPHYSDTSVRVQPTLRAVGRFDPEKLPGFGGAYAAPLANYHAPVAVPADERSRRLLAGRDLLPNGNFAGYLTQPPLLLTTLAALPIFQSDAYFSGGSAAAAAPISVIRVRVAGVRGPDRLSRERIRAVATAIRQRTGLEVDLTAGASATDVRIDLPAGVAGRPALAIREGWVRKGVAVTILQAVDRKSVALFGLVLLVCGFFLGNGALAAVRFRRREIATLRCLGWSPGQVFRAVLGELALVGLAAGLVGTAFAAALVEAFSLRLPMTRTLLVTPVAVVLAVLAGLVPAARAARAVPLDALRPAAATRARPRPVRGLPGLAVRNLLRVPGRTLLGVTGLALSIAALSVLLAVSLAFRGQVAGSLLGSVVSVQVRAVDYVSVALTVLLGAMSVIDVLLVNQRERAGELATLGTTGWSGGELARLTAYEGLGMAAVGSAVGAAAGLALAAALAHSALPTVSAAAALAALGGMAVVLATLLVPLRALSRLTPAAVLAEEE